jgi:DNA primase
MRLSGSERYRLTGKGPLPPGVSAYLEAKYYLRLTDCARAELSWTREYSDKGSGRLILPVRDVNGTLYGFVARRLGEGRGPKTLSFLEDSRGAWYHRAGSKSIVLVEDQLSAIRVSNHVSAVALMGTNISDSLVSALVKQGYDTVHLALDKDAYNKAIRTAVTLRSKLKLRVPQLEKDAKDMNELALIEWLDRNEVYDIPQDMEKSK